MTTGPSHAIAVFVKTPSLSPVKTRLAKDIGAARAEEFYKLSVAAVKEIVTSACIESGSIPFWAVAEPLQDCGFYWKDFEIVEQGSGGLGDRLSHVYGALKKKFDIVTLIGADAPQISSLVLTRPAELLAHKMESSAVIGPADDGGFYLFSSNAELTEAVWKKTTYSTSETLKELLANLWSLHQISMFQALTDVDTATDLPILKRELESVPVLSPAQQTLLTWLRS